MALRIALVKYVGTERKKKVFYKLPSTLKESHKLTITDKKVLCLNLKKLHMENKKQEVITIGLP